MSNTEHLKGENSSAYAMPIRVLPCRLGPASLSALVGTCAWQSIASPVRRGADHLSCVARKWLNYLPKGKSADVRSKLQSVHGQWNRLALLAARISFVADLAMRRVAPSDGMLGRQRPNLIAQRRVPSVATLRSSRPIVATTKPRVAIGWRRDPQLRLVPSSSIAESLGQSKVYIACAAHLCARKVLPLSNNNRALRSSEYKHFQCSLWPF